MVGENGKMRIAVAGGKGGAGKTTVATNLALVFARSGRDVTYVDCDVEEPNRRIRRISRRSSRG